MVTTEVTAGSTLACAELRSLAERLDHVRGDARNLLDGLSEEAVDWSPEESVWSIGECALHVAETNVLYLDRLEPLIRDERARGRTGTGPFRYGWFGRWFLGQVEPPVRRRLPAPKIFRPRGRRGGAESVSALTDTFERLAASIAAADGLDLAASKIATPVTPLLRLQLGICLRVLVAHSDRHLRQMKNLLSRPGFPASIESATPRE